MKVDESMNVSVRTARAAGYAVAVRSYASIAAFGQRERRRPQACSRCARAPTLVHALCITPTIPNRLEKN
jgi:hypothetical protein